MLIRNFLLAWDARLSILETGMTFEQIEHIIEAALLVAGHPLTLNQLQRLFAEPTIPSTIELKNALQLIATRYDSRGIELIEVSSGYRLQAKRELSPWLARLFEERPPRYSRALLETLAIIAYQQPVTRADVEAIRGVAISSPIIKTLLDREWVHVVGHRDTPGKPAIYGTTKAFLDHFNLKSLADLPTLAEFKNLEAQEEMLQVQLALEDAKEDTSLPDNVIEITDKHDETPTHVPHQEQELLEKVE